MVFFLKPYPIRLISVSVAGTTGTGTGTGVLGHTGRRVGNGTGLPVKRYNDSINRCNGSINRYNDL
jgi:hypothetical protein